MYSQNNEDEIVKAYFDDLNKNNTFELPFELLEIGANDGSTFSNSRFLIENGWDAHLVEPSSVYDKLVDLYSEKKERVDENIQVIGIYNVAIGERNEIGDFYESGSILNKGDSNLVSSATPDGKWMQETNFTKKSIKFMTFETFIKTYNIQILDFISIDAEGMDWAILSQINLHALHTKCVCVEWNGDPKLLTLYSDYCGEFGLKEIHRNAENVIFAM